MVHPPTGAPRPVRARPARRGAALLAALAAAALAVTAAGPATGAEAPPDPVAAVGPVLAPAPATPARGPGAVLPLPVLYGPSPTQLGLLFAPPAPTPEARRPAVVLVHGGGFAGGSPLGMGPQADRLVARGAVALSIGYTLGAPGAPSFPTAVVDVATAVAWVREHAAELGVDPGRVGLWGESAGGTLAALAGDGTGAVVTWSAPLDLGLVPDDAPDPLGAIQRWFLGCAPSACPATWAAADPVVAVGDAPPAHLLVASSDEFVAFEHVRAYARAVRARGGLATAIRVPGSTHVRYGDVVVDGSSVMDRSVDWLVARLLAPAPGPVPAPEPEPPAPPGPVAPPPPA